MLQKNVFYIFFILICNLSYSLILIYTPDNKKVIG